MKHQTPLYDSEDKTGRQAGEWTISNFSSAPLYKKHLILKK